ncbi:hypothetical protein A2U01_0077689, partial [Trifolium medium]|nr:hypothetical protein [Trifolium medium]
PITERHVDEEVRLVPRIPTCDGEGGSKEIRGTGGGPAVCGSAEFEGDKSILEVDVNPFGPLVGCEEGHLLAEGGQISIGLVGPDVNNWNPFL